MSVAIEHGKCDVCGKEGPVKRTYYHYDILCECHSPSHFELVKHCENCMPVEPETTNVLLGKSWIWWKTEELKKFAEFCKIQKEKWFKSITQNP